MIATQCSTHGISLVLLSAMMFASYGVWSRMLGDAFPTFYQSYVRAGILSVVLCLVVAHRGELKRIARADLKWCLVFLFFTSATQAPLYSAFNRMDVGSASLLFYVSFLITMYGVGFSFLGEQVSKVKFISLVAACLGLYFVFSFSADRFSGGAAMMAVLAGVASGGEVAFSKKLSDTYSPLYLATLSWICIAVTNMPISFALGEPQVAPQLSVPWLVLLCFTVTSLFGFWAVMAGLKYLEASIAALLGLLEIIFSIALGRVLFNEVLTLETSIGAGLILFAAMLPNLADLHRGELSAKKAAVR